MFVFFCLRVCVCVCVCVCERIITFYRGLSKSKYYSECGYKVPKVYGSFPFIRCA
jgi:hypothetical protein